MNIEYHVERFNSLYELGRFLNGREISPSDIIYIHERVRSFETDYLLLYIERRD